MRPAQKFWIFYFFFYFIKSPIFFYHILTSIQLDILYQGPDYMGTNKLQDYINYWSIQSIQSHQNKKNIQDKENIQDKKNIQDKENI